MNPYPLLEWIKANGATVVGGWGSEEATADYCEYQSRSSSAPPEGQDSRRDASSGSSADLDTGSSDPRPSPVAKTPPPPDGARGALAGQEAYYHCRGSDGGAGSIASSDAWRAVLPPPARFLHSFSEWTRENGRVTPLSCEEDPATDPATSHPTQPGSGEAEDLLANPNFEASPQADGDLRAGIVDERLIATLQAIVKKHRIYVNVFKTGHTFGPGFPEGPTIPIGYGDAGGYPNTHYFGRAVDIWEVDGAPILGCGSDPAVVDVGRMLAGIPPQQRPDVIIGPSAWNEALGYGREAGWILDEDQVALHEDHLHLGFDSAEGTSNTVSQAPGVQEDNGGSKHDEACSGGLRGRPGASSGEHGSGYREYPEIHADPKKNATPNAAGRPAANGNRPGRITSTHNRQRVALKSPGRVVHPQEAPERRSTTSPEPGPEKPVREKPEETGPVAKPNNPQKQKAKESAPRPAPAVGETDDPEPGKPANEKPEKPKPEKPEPEEPEPSPAETVGYGSILPIAFHDRDGDGVRDADEELLAGWTATLIPVGSAGEPATGETGTPFGRLMAGNYVVTVEPASGFTATSPLAEARVNLEAQENRPVDFGFVKPADVTLLLCGDGSSPCADEGGPKSFWKVWLLDAEKATVASGITDPNGRYRFDGLRPGSYTLLAEKLGRASPKWRVETSLVIEEGNSLLRDLAVPQRVAEPSVF
jgi:hypothetical protein